MGLARPRSVIVCGTRGARSVFLEKEAEHRRDNGCHTPREVVVHRVHVTAVSSSGLREGVKGGIPLYHQPRQLEPLGIVVAVVGALHESRGAISTVTPVDVARHDLSHTGWLQRSRLDRVQTSQLHQAAL